MKCLSATSTMPSRNKAAKAWNQLQEKGRLSKFFERGDRAGRGVFDFGASSVFSSGENFFLRLGNFGFINELPLAKETINRCSDLSRGMSHSTANWVGGDRKRPIDVCRRKFMQIFSAKPLSKKLRAGEFWREGTMSHFFAQEIFYAAAECDPARRIDRRAVFEKISLNLRKTKSYSTSLTRIGQANAYGIII